MGTQDGRQQLGKFGSSGLMLDSDYIEMNSEEIFDRYLKTTDPMDLCAPGVDRLTGSMTFFRPDQKFINWLVEYAEDRVVIDVGCGSGHITRMMAEKGAKMVGIDPYLSMNTMANIQMDMMSNGFSAHMLSWNIEDKMTQGLFKGQGNKVLLMYCRPCHSRFVENGIRLADDDTEILYITKPSVVLDYDDLGAYETYAELIPHEGFSVDREKVWSIIKGKKQTTL